MIFNQEDKKHKVLKQMGKISKILKQITHRPWEIPKSGWLYYQQWNHVLFFHWAVDAEILKPLIPEGLELDLFEDKAYISLVPFTMQQIRPRFLPAVSFVSDFHEINLRTYVTKDHKPGVYFLNIESEKPLATFLSRNLSGLPYEKALIERKEGKYTSSNSFKKFFLDVDFAIKEAIAEKSEIQNFLTERYALFLERGGRLFRYDIHHLEWKIRTLEIKKLHLDYRLPGLDLANKQPDLVHYSDGVEVVAWRKVVV